MSIFDEIFKKYQEAQQSAQPVNSASSYELDSRWDENQRKVICLDKGKHLVLAPAGCGKTQILAERVQRALALGVNVDDMLCLTFTNRASRGMRSRVNDTIGEKAADLFIGNTHRFCSKFLFENNIIMQSSAILDEDDVLSIVNSVSRYVMEDSEDKSECALLDYDVKEKLTALTGFQHLMKQMRLGHDVSVFLHPSTKYYNFNSLAFICKQVGLDFTYHSILHIFDNAEQLLQSDAFSYQCRPIIELMIAAKKFDDYKRSEHLIDFDDLLILTYEYARRHPEEIHKYKWIQIDEVQDLNPLQFAIVDAFTAENDVTIYLGDEQQAIFSFIGAKLETLDKLKEKCNGNLHHLNYCYRSPEYLLKVFNDFANFELDTDPDFLPLPTKFDNQSYDDLVVYEADSNETVCVEAAKIAEGLASERTAILVHSNADANNISRHLGAIPHFKISGTDLFSLKQIKLLFSHLNVLNFDINFLAWARILSILKIIPKYSEARKFVSELKRLGMTPSDFLCYRNSSYLLEFLNYYQNLPVVIFDTETTGLDVYSNDIVQIAATKYINRKPVESLNIFLHTDQPIPQKLGKIENPLIQEYANNPHLNREDGLRQFLDFAKDCVLIGHNVQYDYNILIHNCKRILPDVNIPRLFPIVFDTLKLARLVNPTLRSYKLKDLLRFLNLAGENSHLADEDIVATYSVAEYCFEKGLILQDPIRNFLIHNSAIAEIFRQKYASLYLEAKAKEYTQIYDETPALVQELKKAYDYFIQNKVIKPLDKFQYVLDFLQKIVIDKEKEHSLQEQLSNHIMDLNTFKEADICDKENNIVKEKIFIATVHKAKGLEFENVLVNSCVDGIYPFFNTDNPKEDARKLYVAMSRAMKKLYLLTFREKKGISRYGNPYCFPAEISPFLEKIIERHNFTFLSNS